MAGIDENGEKVWRSQKACAELPAVVFDLRDKPAGGGGAQRIRNEAHVESENVSGLRVSALALRFWIVDLPEGRRAVVGAIDRSVGMHERGLKGRFDLFEEIGVLRFVAGAAQRVRHLFHQSDVIGPVSGRKQ